MGSMPLCVAALVRVVSLCVMSLSGTDALKFPSSKSRTTGERMAIVTAEFGRRDSVVLRELAAEPRIDCFLYTDSSINSTDTWTVVSTPYHTWNLPEWGDVNRQGRYSWRNITHPKLAGVMAARFYKLNMFLLPELRDYDMLVWIDAHYLTDGYRHFALNSGMEPAIRRLLGGADALFAEHARRCTVASECRNAGRRITATLGKIPGQRAITREPCDAFEHQVAEGFRDESGLYWTGVFVVRPKAERSEKAMRAWWKEVQTHTFRDQISFPWVVQLSGLRLKTLTQDVMLEVVSKDENDYCDARGKEFAPCHSRPRPRPLASLDAPARHRLPTERPWEFHGQLGPALDNLKEP